MELEASQSLEAEDEALEISSWHPARRPESVAITDDSKHVVDEGETTAQDDAGRSTIGQEVPHNRTESIPSEAASPSFMRPQSSLAEDMSEKTVYHSSSPLRPPSEPSVASVKQTVAAEEETEGQNSIVMLRNAALQTEGSESGDSGVEEVGTHPDLGQYTKDLHHSLNQESNHTMSGSNTSATNVTKILPSDLPETLQSESQSLTCRLNSPSDFSRSNSFPEVPLLRINHDLNSMVHLPHSQVESIMEEIEETNHMEENLVINDSDGLQGDLQVNDIFDNNSYANEEESFADISGIGGRETSMLVDEEARFEEGIPLVQGYSDNQNEQEPDFDVFGKADGSDDGFFAQVSSPPLNDGPFKPQSLDRKMTSQVLDSMTFPHYEEVHEIQSKYEDVPSVQDWTEATTATSISTIISEVPTERMKSDEKTEGNSSQQSGNQKQDHDLDALWQAALGDDDLLEDELPVDQSGFFDDGDGFLGDSDTLSVPRPVSDSNGQVRGFDDNGTTNVQSTTSRDTSQLYLQKEQQQIMPLGFSSQYANSMQQSPYTPNGAFQSNHSQSPMNYTGSRQQSPYGVPEPLQRPGMPEKTQSFVDKSKGGYTSPYDLPMDVTSRPKKRINPQPLPNRNQNLANIPAPPPRSNGVQPTTAPSNGLTSFTTSPVVTTRPSLPPTAFSPTAPPKIPAGASSKSAIGTFFEEIPIAAKPRVSSNLGKPSLAASSAISVPQQPPYEVVRYNQQPPIPRKAINNMQTSADYQLLPPERISPFTNTATASPANQAIPVSNPRYSPAPPAPSGPLSNRARYATPPIGPPRPPSATQILPFQPRTSSPLTRSTSATHQYQLHSQPMDSQGPPNNFPPESRRPSLRPYYTDRPLPPAPEVRDSQAVTGNASPDFENDLPPASEFESKQHPLQYHHPLEESQVLSPDIHALDSPRRSQTQSPGSMMPQSDVRVVQDYGGQRRVLLDDTILPGASNPYHTSQIVPAAQVPSSEKAISPEINYLIPSDGREKDPLERWKGCPLFFFGFGGTAVTSFPKQIPRFTGQPTPFIKCSPGEVKLRMEKELSLDNRVVSFPGPLKSKNKKKDVLEWLGKSIQQLSQQYVSISPDQILEDSRKRHEEKILLWKVLQTLVEHDGVVDGSPAVENAIRTILSPELITGESSGQISYDSNLPLRRISKSSMRKNHSHVEDPEALEGLRKLLLSGEREKAVWHAVDQRLWGHAILLASTLSREVWKQVVQEFVHNEVKTYGDNTESLAALYDIFAGNWEESIDELVPPSARAGLQMVSKSADPGSVKNATGLDGLDRWRETLSLVISNRTPDDGRALVSLGQLLSRYGRIEAAHICFIFARSQTLFGGPDDNLVNVVLFGADHVQQPFDYARDLDSILLTEVYEFALNVLAPSSASTTTPHLQAHKLYHAIVLAEHGYRDEAQQYCDNIQNTLKGTTKLSPYYHNRLFSALDDLSSRLKQAPKDGSASWITRPSMDKVSGSVWSRFNQFVSGGDDSDTASIGSGRGLEGEAGPFSKVSGDTPTISRGPSPNGLYGSHGNGGLYNPGLAISNTPYAPVEAYAPRSSHEQPRHPERYANSLQDPSRLHGDSLKQANLHRQSSYSSMPTSSADLYKKPQLDVHQSISRPSTANVSSSKRDYSPTPVLSPEGLSERTRSNPSYMNESQQPYSSASPYSQHLTPPDDYTTSINLEQPPIPDEKSLGDNEPSSSYESSSTHNTGHGPFVDQRISTSYHPGLSTYEPSPTFNQPYSTCSDPVSGSEKSPTIPYGYAPPTTTGSYEYKPYTEDSEMSPVDTKPKKKTSYMDDDDDDFEAKAVALLRKGKEKEKPQQRGREPDEAVRRAAEEDGKRPFSMIYCYIVFRLID